MKLTLREFGGLAGFRARQRALVDTSALPPDIAHEIETLARVLLEDGDFGVASTAQARPDSLMYDISVDESGTPTVIPAKPTQSEVFEKLRRRLLELSSNGT